MGVIKNIKRKTEITKELIFPLDVIAEELQKKYRMADCDVQWVDSYVEQDEAGNDVTIEGSALILSGTSTPRKKAAAPVDEAGETDVDPATDTEETEEV